MKKKNRICTNTLIVLGLLLILTNSCKKDDNNNPSNTVTDIEGNFYHTVTIGTQVWMVENLKVTHYRNGDPIPNVTDGTEWINLTTGAYCNYNNDANNSITYGRLYNWYTIADSRNIAPSGWHIPTDVEWTTLTTYLGGEIVAGGKPKETGKTHWPGPNSDATNETGFTALPGGDRWVDGAFEYIGIYGFWWSSAEVSNNGNIGWYRSMHYYDSGVVRINYGSGYSVRCLRD